MYFVFRLEVIEYGKGVSLRVSAAHKIDPSPTVLISKLTVKYSLFAEG